MQHKSKHLLHRNISFNYLSQQSRSGWRVICRRMGIRGFLKELAATASNKYKLKNRVCLCASQSGLLLIIPLTPLLCDDELKAFFFPFTPE